MIVRVPEMKYTPGLNGSAVLPVVVDGCYSCMGWRPCKRRASVLFCCLPVELKDRKWRRRVGFAPHNVVRCAIERREGIGDRRLIG